VTRPRATYRLQFRGGMTFDRAAGLAPYLAEIGISHLYASPIFTAAPGSTHGYDVADHGELDPVLGGEEGFARLVEALKANGLGLILDIVPNHMATSMANPWWRDVLKFGAGSAYARHFDIDWNAPKLLLPVLGETYGEALEGGKLSLGINEAGEPAFRYYDLALPLASESIERTLRDTRLAGAAPRRDEKHGKALEAAIAEINGDLERLHQIHEAQVWRLGYWRLAREALTYRRFFEITDLVGVRVEDASVFADVHRKVLELVGDGAVDGLRIDHVDGLADPKAYLARLRQASGLDYIVVEKILWAGEELRPDWACEGTTGYEVAGLLTGIQVESGNRDRMINAWSAFSGENPDFDAHVADAKRRILTFNFAGELDALVRLAHGIALCDFATRDFGRDAIRLALIELAVAMPVYRTYVDENGPSEADRSLILRAAAHVDRDRIVEDDRVVRFIASLVLSPAGDSAERTTFIRRFQQMTGPLMAKSVEDTVFYRFNPLLALNEVGGEPDAFGVSMQDFHAAIALRNATWPAALSATATHDTKRGEDARARLAVLSEMPEAWAAAVRAWHEAAAPLRDTVRGNPAPGKRGEWPFFQALAGAWPVGLTLDDEAGLQDLCQRLVAFVSKAFREAKRRTSWTDQDQRFEGAVDNYIRSLFSPERRAILGGIHATIATIEPAGFVNSLAQLALKMTLPGVPDIYQGTELPDHSMVDPDNRRPVDFELRQKLLPELRAMSAQDVMKRWRDGLPKFWLMLRLLDLRRRSPGLFAEGTYEPLDIEGDGAAHVIAFARRSAEEWVMVAVPRLALSLTSPDRPALIAPSVMDGTFLQLPVGADRFLTLDGSMIEAPDGRVALSELWSALPVAVLEAV